MTPRLLDLFGGAGGAARGYQRAGFHVTSVDIEAQPDSCADEFVQASALAVLADWEYVAGFDLVHASPPCQASCALTKGTNRGREYVNLIPVTRELLRLVGVPWVIENVQGADLRRDLTLCGEMFGLGVIRHRYFEVDGFTVAQPAHVPHRGRVRGWRHGQWFDGPYVAVYGDGGGKGTVAEWQQAMGIDWTDSRLSIAEAIPPAYSQLVGEQFLAQRSAAAA